MGESKEKQEGERVPEIRPPRPRMPDLTWPQFLAFLVFVCASLASVFRGVAHQEDVVLLAMITIPLLLFSDLLLRLGRLYLYFRKPREPKA